MIRAALVVAGVLGAAFGQPASAQARPMSPESFAAAAAQSDQFEIMSGRLAATQSQDARVTAFARQLIDDHTKTSMALEDAARRSGLPPPRTVGGDQQRMLSALQSLKGRDLDRTWVTQQVNAHTSALVTQQAYAASGADPNLRQAAQSAIPIIQHHLMMAEQMKASMGQR